MKWNTGEKQLLTSILRDIQYRKILERNEKSTKRLAVEDYEVNDDNEETCKNI